MASRMTWKNYKGKRRCSFFHGDTSCELTFCLLGVLNQHLLTPQYPVHGGFQFRLCKITITGQKTLQAGTLL
jgi:hypothetical protein